MACEAQYQCSLISRIDCNSLTTLVRLKKIASTLLSIRYLKDFNPFGRCTGYELRQKKCHNVRG